MAVPTSKEELQQAIHTNYEKLKKELSEIPYKLTSINKFNASSPYNNERVRIRKWKNTAKNKYEITH